ncbi:MAG: hypothetical protein JHC95_02370 [Solirubrobacteraceae bacterium]|nr:hypothetical protein [Solirubrobacteraceae bacterium]
MEARSRHPRRRARIVSMLAVAASLLAPAAASGATPASGFFGLGNWSTPSTQQAATMGQIGMRTWRAGLVWQWVEPTQGNRNWNYVDQLVREGARNGYDTLLVLNGCAQWACGAQRVAPAQEPQLTAYKQFVAAAVARYGANGAFWSANPSLPRKAVSWQVWNEVNAGQDWPYPNAAAYASFLASINETIKGVDPSALVVTSGLTEYPAISSGATLARFLTDLYAQPAFRSSFDVLAVHGYAESPAGVVRILDTARRIVAQNGDSGRRIWITEMGWSSGGPAHPFTLDEGGQASYMQQSFDTLVGCRSRWNLDRAYWFSLGDISSAALGEADYWGHHTGLQRVDGSGKPAWNAFTEYTGEKALPGGRGDGCSLPGGAQLDTSAIDTVISSAPQVIGSKDNPKVSFTASREARFECSLDGAPWAACQSPVGVKTSREGAHELAVRAIDGGGVADTTPARATWVLDLTAPDTVLTKKPPKKLKKAKVQLRFKGTDATGVASYQCRVLGKAWNRCKSGDFQKLSGKGLKRMQVRAVDRAGNVDPAPAQATVTLNLCSLRTAAKKAKGKKASCTTSSKKKAKKKAKKKR